MKYATLKKHYDESVDWTERGEALLEYLRGLEKRVDELESAKPKKAAAKK